MSKYKFRADEVHVSTLFGRHLPLSVEVEMDTPQAKHAFLTLAGDTRLNELGEWMEELGYTIQEIRESV